jgi:hypothetical protein
LIRAAAAAMYRRRGNLITWNHAVAASKASFDSLTGGPIASIGGGVTVDVGPGNFGETYLPGVAVFAYFSNKTTSFSQQAYGVVNIGDAQVDFAVPYVQAAGSALLADASPNVDPPVAATTPSLSDYNNGNFAVLDSKGEAIAFDRFEILGITWQAKAKAVPIVDRNVVVAWRLLIGKVTV